MCLRKVFWWLCDQDRVRATRVCHHWHQVRRALVLLPAARGEASLPPLPERSWLQPPPGPAGAGVCGRLMSWFSCLSTLNYSCISDDLLQALASSRVVLNGVGSLCPLTVHCRVHEPHVQVIWGDAWARPAQTCPALKVPMSVEQILTIGRLRHILL